jgi:hypothetical protein
MKCVLGIVITLAVLGVGVLLFAWSGIYNIAATKPHWGITLSFIEMLRDRSISVRSDDIGAADSDDAKLMEAAFIHYHVQALSWGTGLPTPGICPRSLSPPSKHDLRACAGRAQPRGNILDRETRHQDDGNARLWPDS